MRGQRQYDAALGPESLETNLAAIWRAYPAPTDIQRQRTRRRQREETFHGARAYPPGEPDAIMGDTDRVFEIVGAWHEAHVAGVHACPLQQGADRFARQPQDLLDSSALLLGERGCLFE